MKLPETFDASVRLPNGRKPKHDYTTQLEEEFDAVEAQARAGVLVGMYLVHSYIYYKLNENIIDDHLYDELAATIGFYWDELDHRHKPVIDRGMLENGGSGFYIEYPTPVEGSAKLLLSQHKNGHAAHPSTNELPISEHPKATAEVVAKLESQGVTTFTTQPQENDMGGRSSQQKGKRGERAVIELLQPILDRVYKTFGLESPMLQRNTLQFDAGGFDICGLDWLACEVKNCETFQLDKWWEEAKTQAETQKKRFHKECEPVLMYKRNNAKFRVRMKGYIPCGERKVRTVVDIGLDSFLVWFEERVKQELATLGHVAQPV
jgi:hypothetical protein